MKKVLTLVVVLALAFSTPVFATTLTEHANSDDYLLKAPSMIARGIGNALLAPTEFIYHTIDRSFNGEPVIGIFEGLLTGTQRGLDFAGRGLLDVVGALIPGYNGHPPEHTAEILKR